jgi:S1-C subfamily serine protease
VQQSLAGKTGPQPRETRPELLPGLREKYTDQLNYSGDVVKSCIHCHQIGDAIRDGYRAAGQAIPEEVLNPYPHPRSLGLVLNPDEAATVREVQSGSLAEKAGFQAGDQILRMAGQPLLSLADVQWVLHQVPAGGGMVAADVQRGGQQLQISLSLPDGWRRLDNISWRVSAWGLRRMATGGLQLEPVGEAERGREGIPATGMALRVRHVGQFGPHAAAKTAGFQQGDILLSLDGRTNLLTESDVLRYGVTERRAGDQVPAEILRNGQTRKLQLPQQP